MVKPFTSYSTSFGVNGIRESCAKGCPWHTCQGHPLAVGSREKCIMRIYGHIYHFFKFWIGKVDTRLTLCDFAGQFYRVAIMKHLCQICLIKPDYFYFTRKVFYLAFSHRNFRAKTFLCF